jgi:hypothetical protein
VALAFAIHADAASGLSLVGTFMMIASALGFPIVGWVLGLLQVLQDNRIGRWGFLTHRPISRTRIFFAKVLAGVVLYLAATMVPLAAAIGWVARPGHLAAPFDWHMVLPRSADLFGGLMWYAVGLLIASRRARWIGSRLMPIGLALIVASLAWVLPLNLFQALLILTGGIALLLPAACSTFTTAGIFERQSAIPRLLQTFTVSIGIMLSLALVVGIMLWIVGMFHPDAVSRSENYQIDENGRVLRMTWGPTEPLQAFDLQGHMVSDARRWSSRQLSVAFLSLKGFPTENSPWDLRRQYGGLQGPDAYVHSLGVTSSTAWFYVAQRKTIEGFDRFSRRLVDSIGPNGFAPASGTSQPFPEPLYPQAGFVIAGRTAVYQLNSGERKVRTYSRLHRKTLFSLTEYISRVTGIPPC